MSDLWKYEYLWKGEVRSTVELERQRAFYEGVLRRSMRLCQSESVCVRADESAPRVELERQPHTKA